MTRPAPHSAPTGPCGCEHPEPTTLVLLHRRLVPNVATAALSVFTDDWWDLTPGVFEAHTQPRTLDLTACPASLRPAIKHYLWELINHAAPQPFRGAHTDRLSLASISVAYRTLLPFLTWLDTHALTRLDQVTHQHLDRYLADVVRSENSRNVKGDRLIEVRRLWCYRSRLPEIMRLPAAPPWDGEDNAALLGKPAPRGENTTTRIHPDVLRPLLLWSLRFVQEFADDIVAAFTEYQHLTQRGGLSRHRLPAAQRETRSRDTLRPVVLAWLDQLRQRGSALPGIVRPDGTREIHWLHLTRVFDCTLSTRRYATGVGQLIRESGLPIADDAYLDTPITGQLDGKPWRTKHIAFTEAPQLARLLATASAVTIAYLSGMRPGELLNLERDCIDYDPVTELWQLRGSAFKAVTGSDGQKLPEGEQRLDPWTVIQPVAHAIDVLHRLHPHPMLFPNQLAHHGTARGPKRRAQPVTGRKPHRITEGIAELTAWINQHCRDHDRDGEFIPADSHGRITLARFRRTLAWHIVRRPRGLIAGAIQYGHIHLKITLGYAGSYDSGFPDDHAYEDWLYRLEQLADREHRLAAGEHVSGPAADTYRHRVHTAQHTFAGRVLTTTRQAHDLLGNPLLQIFPGRAMTCVFDATTALCTMHRTEADARRTPDQHDCRPTCRNIAYTDHDIAQLQARARVLRDLTTDPLAPSIRQARERHELDRIHAIIARHHKETR